MYGVIVDTYALLRATSGVMPERNVGISTYLTARC